MTTLRYERSEHSAVPAQEVLNYIREHSSVRHVHCIATFNDENVQSLVTILLENHAHTNIETLSLPRNDLTLNAAQAIARLLYANATIQNLNLSYNSLGYQGAQALVQPLVSANTTLVCLNLTHNDLGPRGAASIATLLAHTTAVRELRLGNNHFGSRGIRVLAPKLTACTSLLHLDVSHNHLGSQGIHFLSSLLPPLLHYLDVTGNRACQTGTRALASWLLSNKSCNTLLLNSNEVDHVGAASLSTVLKYNHTLLHLQMGGNHIANAGAMALAEGLRAAASSCLQTLKLDWNHISNQGAQALGDALMSNASLAELDLSGNQIGNDGSVALAKALPFNVKLTSLNLSRNVLQDTAALAFADALVGVNRILITLILEDNPISDNGIAQIQHCFRYRDNYKVWFGRLLEQQLKYLHTLNLLSRHIGDEEIIALAPKLGSNNTSSLRALYIGGNLITARGIVSLAKHYLSKETCQLQRLYILNTCMGNDGAQAIADAKNHSLRVLTMSCCGITATGAKALGTFLQDNTTLVRLTLDGNAIGNEGFKELVKQGLLHELSVVESLSVANCGITNAVCIAKTKTRLTHVNLRGNDINDCAALDLWQSLMEHHDDDCSIEWLCLCDNKITERGGKALARSLAPRTILEYM
jgi:Ran GTPase-activating protein (RanGAP) involved in mRNA processing and transport